MLCERVPKTCTVLGVQPTVMGGTGGQSVNGPTSATVMEHTPQGTGEQQDDNVDAISDGIQQVNLNEISEPMTPMDEADIEHIQQMMDQMQVTSVITAAVCHRRLVLVVAQKG